jgi:KDO2-lipid IV(A) lauroyltransferase
VAKKSKPKVWLEYALARVLLGFLAFLPRRAAVRLMTTLAGLAYHVFGGLRRVAMTNLNIAFPELSEKERERLAKGSFRNLGRVLGEMSHFGEVTAESIGRLVEFPMAPAVHEEIRDLRAAGRGVVLVSPHLGNWEVLVLGWAVFESPLCYLVRPLDNPLVEQMTVDLRKRLGNQPINKTHSFMTAAKVLRREGQLGILADVNAHPKEGVFVPFFGVPACTPSGAALLAMRTNAGILVMCGAWDESKQRYVAAHGRMVYPSKTGDRQRDIVETTASFTAEVEKLVRKFPDQWMWIHKRWKTRPPGEPDIYV